MERLRFKDDEASVTAYIVKSNLDKWLAHEESFLKQRSKSFWVQKGDLNARFFHAIATTRKRVNTIRGLYDGADN